MQIGMIGLGRMGANMVRRLTRGGHSCLVFDLNPENMAQLAGDGATATTSIAEMVEQMAAPRAIWIMVPAGEATHQTVEALSELLSTGDIVIDGGNSHFKDDVRRAARLAKRGIRYVDVGTSGGVWGAERGYCLMIGGEESAFLHLEPIFQTLAPGRGSIERTPGRNEILGGEETKQKFSRSVEEGYLYCGPSGAGHFVKMIHNGIEYGLMQAFAEGFDIMRNAGINQLAPEHRYDLNLADIAELWRRGSVVSSWLLDLTAIALLEDPTLASYSGYVQDSGEGRWTIEAAIEEAVPAEVLAASLFTRFRSRQEHTFAEKILSAMRHKFGGHTEKK
ncbi:MAG: decarboxylating 6-phosphogluconate dehydrogenase [Acidobacteria bacterium]|nr:decarboxylating 6-phosphogluconate dehydrogenase [Acidobacteriota bacterium]